MTEHTNTLQQPIGLPLPDWQPCAPPQRNPMVGRFTRLESVDVDAHAADLYDAFSLDTEGRIWTYLPYGPFESINDFRGWMTTTCLGDDPLFHAIVDQATGRAVGVASYLRIEPPVGVIEVGHINFSPELQRTAAATEAMYLLMRRVFDELGYRRYEWKCDALNAGSRSAAGRLGFTFEGVFRQATMYKGRNRDTAWFSITDIEWPAIRAEFERWLDPANFGTDGVQVTPLRHGR